MRATLGLFCATFCTDVSHSCTHKTKLHACGCTLVPHAQMCRVYPTRLSLQALRKRLVKTCISNAILLHLFHHQPSLIVIAKQTQKAKISSSTMELIKKPGLFHRQRTRDSNHVLQKLFFSLFLQLFLSQLWASFSVEHKTTSQLAHNKRKNNNRY